MTTKSSAAEPPSRALKSEKVSTESPPAWYVVVGPSDQVLSASRPVSWSPPESAPTRLSIPWKAPMRLDASDPVYPFASGPVRPIAAPKPKPL